MPHDPLPRLMTEAGPTVAAAPSLGPFADLKVIGPYHVLTLVGEGGMGLVYKAEQRQPIRRTVAIKIIKLGMDTKEVIARFESERQALAMLSHPNVAKVLDAGASETGRPYFVMEFVPGEPITTYCDRHQLTTRQRLELFVQACDAIQHAHSKAIIHRDIKPSNVLVTLVEGKPIVKVIDFGVAKATNQRLTERTVFTELGKLIGTPEYMSPEQAEMGGLDVDTRTDIYSLGVVLYELLSGTLPFESKSLRSAAYGEIQRIIREVDPPRPSTRLSSLGDTGIELAKRRQTELGALARELRSELEWIPLKALRKDRSERYRTAAELSEDINNYLAARPLIAAPESVAYRARKFAKRNRGPVVTALTILFVLIAGVVGTSIGFVRAERQRRDAVAARESAEAVNQFLTKDVIGSADPAVTRGRPLNVRDALDNAARSVSQEFTNHPLTEASVRVSLASAYEAVGRADLGLPHAQAALDIRQRLLGPDHPDTLKAKHVLAMMLQSQTKLSDAEVLYKQVLEARRRVLGADHAQTLETEHNLAAIHEAQDKLPQAERELRDVLARQRRALGEDDLNTIQTVNTLSMVLNEQGKQDQAEALLREAADRLRRLVGEDHPETISVNGRVAKLLHDRGKLADAEAMFRQSLAQHRRVFGDDHVRTLNAMNAFTMLLKEEGKLAEAEAIAREAVQRSHRVLGDQPDTWYATTALASILESQGKLAEAETLYQDALEGYRRSFGAEHTAVLTLTNDLAGMLHARGKSAEAEPLFRQALDGYRRVYGDDHVETLTIVNNLGRLLDDMGRGAEAEALLAPALERARKALGNDHPNTVHLANSLGLARKSQGKLDQAEPLFREALAGYRRIYGEKHQATFVAMNNLAKLLQAQGKRSEAEAMFREALAGVRAACGDDHPMTLRTLNNLGVVLCEMKRDADAEPLLAELYQRAQTAQLPPKTAAVFMAWQGPCLVRLGQFAQAEAPLREAYRRLSETDQMHGGPMRQVVEALAQVCEHTNRPDDARAWRAQLASTQPATTTSSR